MKITLQSNRADSAGRHNDRNYDVTKSAHIDSSRSSDNRYYTYNGQTDATFEEVELAYYKEHFRDALMAQHKKNSEARKSKRNKTMTQVYHSATTRPEDVIIQVGNFKEHITGDELWAIAEQYRNEFESRYGLNCKILTMALHMDEETPHVHVRRVWSYHSEEGYEKISQGKALDELGILPEDTSASISKLNNAKITFTRQEREMLKSICLEHNIELDDSLPSKRKHLNVPEYKTFAAEIEALSLESRRLAFEIEEQKDALEEMNKETSDMAAAIKLMEDLLLVTGRYEQEIAALRKKSLKERLVQLANMYEKESEIKKFEESISAAKSSRNQILIQKEREIQSLKKFLEKHDLLQDYDKATKKDYNI